MCRLGGRHCETVPILGLCVLVHPTQTGSETHETKIWMFLLNKIVIKISKLANLIGKLNFYRLIPYPMVNC